MSHRKPGRVKVALIAGVAKMFGDVVACALTFYVKHSGMFDRVWVRSRTS